ncbi:dihydrodipicolinate synthase family protein [Novosphingobium sp.]|uniref:dihydrodipicolinate synthase family protein n=1 Tax=Novosphingobium sp. TaxID=1874826 RepID=UPI002628F86C|nr:dihydrodipicolinate synthase family protein [Novosphingobium sp.]
MNQVSISGVFPVLPTVFDAAGNPDLDGMANVVEYVIGSGADGLVFPGLASEYDMLTLEERSTLITFVGERVRGRVAMVVGASSDQVADSARLAQAGAAAGAVAAMVMTPRAIGGEAAALADFYTSLGATAGLPIMLQNAPAPMGLGLDSPTVAHIARSSPAVAWVKEETMPCGQRISALRQSGLAQLKGVFGGAGGRYIVDELRRGAIGSMPAAETPEVHVALMKAFRRGDWDTVRRLYEALLPILMVQAVFRWRLTKEVLLRRGVIRSTFTRAPGPAFDAADLDELGTILTRLEAACPA